MSVSRNVRLRYEATRKKHEQELEERRAEALGRFPRLEEIEREEKQLAFNLIRSILKSENIVEELEAQSHKLRQERQAILRDGGYPSDYLLMAYNCEKCKDTGIVDTSFCTCRNKILTEELYKLSGIAQSIVTQNFSTFDPSIFRANRNNDELYSPREMIQAYRERTLRYAQEGYKKGENLLFTGSVGTGKTFLLNCIAKELMDRGVFVFYESAVTLMKILTDYQFSKMSERPAVEGKFSLVKNAQVLIIDDLGTELSSSVNTSHLFDLLNDRLIRGLSTLISTNLSLEEIRDYYDERIFSRILGEYEILSVFGDDLRISKFNIL